MFSPRSIIYPGGSGKVVFRCPDGRRTCFRELPTPALGLPLQIPGVSFVPPPYLPAHHLSKLLFPHTYQNYLLSTHYFDTYQKCFHIPFYRNYFLSTRLQCTYLSTLPSFQTIETAFSSYRNFTATYLSFYDVAEGPVNDVILNLFE